MKLTCGIVQDLLPLYLDGVCSPDSCRGVEDHLEHCPDCRHRLEAARGLQLPDPAPEVPAQVLQRGLRKIRRRWRLSALTALVLVPLLVLGWRTATDTGLHPGNAREAVCVLRFLERLQAGDLSGAYDRLDLAHKRQSWLADWFTEGQLTDLEADGRTAFLEAARPLQEAGGLERWRYLGIENSGESYTLYFRIWIGGEAHLAQLQAGPGGIRSFGCEGSWRTDPFARLALWSEDLWQRYSGLVYDPDAGEYLPAP